MEEKLDNQRIWDNNWSKLAQYSTQSAGNKWAFFLIRKILKKINLSEGYIVDMGCGMGNKSAVLAELFPACSVVGYDFSNEGIEFAKQYYKRYENLNFECADATKIKKDEGQIIQLVSAFELIEHLQDWQSFVKEMCRISDRYVLISTPTGKMREYEKKLGHYRNFKKNEIEIFMEKQGYKKVDVLYAGFPFWSPLTRDYYNFISGKNQVDKDEMTVSFNRLFHVITYILYRYFTFSRIGDEFMGLFEKVSEE